MSSTHVGETFITDVILIRINLSMANFEEYKASSSPLSGIFSNELIEAALRNMAHGVLDGLPLLNGHPLKVRLESCVFRQEEALVFSHVYVSLHQATAIDDAFLNDAKEVLRALFEKSLSLSVAKVGNGLDLTRMELSRLTQISNLPGYSSSEKSLIHYVVQTDVQSGWELEIDHWYAQEHLPGLASVPGCVVAKRYLNHDAGPKSLACYDLLSQETLISKAWLAVRATPWASQARPHFINTQREIYPHVLALT